MKIAIVAGTRPEFVKLAPVVAELRRRGESPQVIATGQHTDLLRGTPFDDGMAPDVNLEFPGTNDPFGYATVCEELLRAFWTQGKPELVIVQGDTASAYAGALAAKQLDIPVAHVEAGIRSGDLQDPFPEEQFRIAIDEIAVALYAPTAHAATYLLDGYEADPDERRFEAYRADGKRFGVKITGNPGIDALYSHTQPVEQSQKVDRVLITLHRRESFGEPLANMIGGIFAGGTKYPKVDFVWPSHPNPHVQSQLDARWPEVPQNVRIHGPMETVRFAQMLATSRVVITDSGGVQEEACALGVACVVARNLTDRPESVELGLARVAGRTEAGILAGLAWALDAKIEPSTVFGDGHASPRIVEHLLG